MPKTAQDELPIRRENALKSAVDVVVGAMKTKVADDELLRLARKRISCYCQTVKHLAAEPGEKKHKYRYRTLRINPGFAVEIVHSVKDEIVVDFTSDICVTVSEAKAKADEWAGANDKRPFQYRVWYDGERNFDEDQASFAALKVATLSLLVTLVSAGQKKDAASAAIDQMLSECYRGLERYFSRKHLFESQWDSLGTWIGPKKSAKKQKKVDNAQSEDTMLTR